MVEISGAVQMMPLPWEGIRQYLFGLNRAVPKFNGLLVRPDIVNKAEANYRAAYKTAILFENSLQHLLNHIGFKNQIIIQKKGIGGGGSIEQKLALLGQATARKMAVGLDGVAVRLKYVERSPDFARMPGRTLDGLIGDDNPEIPVGLSAEAG